MKHLINQFVIEPCNEKVRYHDFILTSYLSKVQASTFLDNLLQTGYISHYAFILHDSDFFSSDDSSVKSGRVNAGDPKKPHLHILISCYSGHTVSAVFRIFNASDFLDSAGLHADTYYCAPQKNKVACYDYLTHKDDPFAHQYSVDDIVASQGAYEHFNKQTVTDQNINAALDSSVLALRDLIAGADLQTVALSYGRDFIFHYPAIRLLIQDLGITIKVRPGSKGRLL